MEENYGDSMEWKPPLSMSLSAFEEQVGGDHYKHFPMGYQPMQIAYKTKMDAYQFAMLKYLLRDKVDRIEDLDKLIHVAQMYKEELISEGYTPKEKDVP